MPALPLDEAGKYVAGAYVVFVMLILIYVAIMAAKLGRIESELRELAGFAEARNHQPASDQASPGSELRSPPVASGSLREGRQAAGEDEADLPGSGGGGAL